MTARRIAIVVSSAEEDKKLRDEFLTHLKPRARRGLEFRHEGTIPPGDEKNGASADVDGADIVLALLTPDLLAEDARVRDVQRALAAKKIVPILARPCDWEAIVSSETRRLPINDKAVTLWDDRDAAWDDVREGVDEILGLESALERRYREAIVRKFEHLRVPSPSGSRILFPLEDVFVDLLGRPFAPTPANAMDPYERWVSHLLDDGPTSHRDHLGQQLDAHWYDKNRTVREAVPHWSLLERISRRDNPMVVLGDPGAGKSTLLHLLALRTARRKGVLPTAPPWQHMLLPLFASLALWKDGWSIEELLCQQWSGDGSMQRLFARALWNGRCVVLLDGLDETGDEDRRASVVSAIEAFGRRWRRGDNRFVITSRVVGYAETPLGDDFEQAIVLDFSTQEIDLFLQRWYTILGRLAGLPKNVIEHRAREKAASLKAVMSTSPGLDELAKNPLMLSTLATIHDRGHPPSSLRANVHNDFVRMALETWPTARSPTVLQGREKTVSTQELRDHARVVALEIQKRGKGPLISRKDLLLLLEQSALDFEGLHKSPVSRAKRVEAQEKAILLFDSLSGVEGLFAERGPDTYGFLHRMLQESLAAEALARLSADERWQLVARRLHDPAWRETLLLTSSWLAFQVAAPHANDLVRRVLDAGSPSEDLLRRDLFLAAAMLGEDIGASPSLLDDVLGRLRELMEDGIPARTKLALRAVATLARIGHGPSEDFLLAKVEAAPVLATDGVSHEVFEAAGVALRSTRTSRLRNAVLRQVKRHFCDGSVHFSPVQSVLPALVELSRSDEGLKSFLLETTKISGSYELLSAMQRLVSEDGVVRETFIAMVRSPVTGELTLNLLARAAPHDPDVKALLERQWKEDVTRSVRAAIFPAVAQWASASPEWLAEVHRRMASPDSNERGEALSALAELVRIDPGATAMITEHTRGSDLNTASNAFAALGKIAREDASVLDILVAGLQRPEMQIRRSVAGALRAAARIPLASSVLESLLEDYDESVRDTARSALAEAPALRPSAREKLRALLAETTACRKAVQIATVAPLVGADRRVRERIIELLSSEDPRTRCAAVAALRPLVRDDCDLRGRLRAMLSDGEPRVRQAVLQALEVAITNDGDLRKVVVELARSGAEGEALCAARVLGTAADVEEVRAELLELLVAGDRNVRVEVSKILQPFIADDDRVRLRFLEIAAAFTGLLTDPEASVGALVLSGAAGCDLVLKELVRARVPNILQSVQWFEALATTRTLEGRDLYFSLRSAATNLVSLIARHARDLDAFDIMAQLHQHHWFCYEAMIGLSAWMDDRDDVRRFIHEAARSDVLSSLGRRFQPRSLDLGARDLLAKRLPVDLEAARVLLEAASEKQPQSSLPDLAAELLAPHVGSIPEIKQAFERILRDPAANFGTRMRAAAALAPFASEEPELVEPLLDWLGARTSPEDERGATRRDTIAKGLARAAAERSEIRVRLLGLLESPAWQERQGAAWALLHGDVEVPAGVREKIATLLYDGRAEESWLERLDAAKVLLNHREATLSDAAVQVAAAALEYGRMPWHGPLGVAVRRKAAEVLAAIDPVTQDAAVCARIRAALLCENDPDAKSRLFIALSHASSAAHRGEPEQVD